jgi:hypothetical protein
MKRWLPGLRESLELLALTLMMAGLQWTIQSWGWVAFFTLGFLWNWAVLNGWVRRQVVQKKYRFSLLRGITRIHDTLTSQVRGRWKWMVEILPAGLVIGAVALLLESPVPWWSAFLGSLALVLVRRQLREFL